MVQFRMTCAIPDVCVQLNWFKLRTYIAKVFQIYIHFDFYYDYIVVLYSAILKSQPVAIFFLV